MARGYDRKEIGISQSKMLRIKLKSKFKGLLEAYEREHIGSSFDKNYDILAKSVSKFVSSPLNF